MTEIQCIFCGKSAQELDDGFYISKDIHSIECKVCGKYKITYEAYEDFPGTKLILNDNNRWIYSGYLREMTERQLDIKEITRDNYVEILNSPIVPKTIKQKLDKLLWHLYRKTNEQYFGEEIQLDFTNDYSLLYAKNPEEAMHIIFEFRGGMYDFEGASGFHCDVMLNAKGFDYIQQKNEININDRGFVAMWFDPQMDDMFTIIQEAVSDQTDYKIYNINIVEHNGDINDEIIAEIRRSKFLIADFTGDRGGVYYEAGFAYGLGKEVIYTCRKDWFMNEIWHDGKIKNDKGNVQDGKYLIFHKPHFDIDHNKFIIWETPE